MNKGWVVVSIAASMWLAGCMAPLERKVEDRMAVVEHEAREHVEAQGAMNESYLRDVPRIWIGGEPTPVRSVRTLPPAFDQPVTLKRDVPITLQMVAELVSTHFDLPTRVTPDAVDAAATNAADPLSESLGRGSATGGFLLQYQGTLKGLLDLATARTGNAWRYEDGTVTIFHHDTRVFFVDAVPVTSTVDSNITNESEQGNQSGGSGGSGGTQVTGGATVSSGQSASIRGEFQAIESVAETVKGMLTKGGTMAVSKAANSITVTDTPVVLDRVASVVDTINQRLTRQVVIDVRVYQVELATGESYGIDWDLIYQSLNGRYGITTHSVSEAVQGAQSLNLSIIDPTYKWNGTQLLVNALATQGNVAARTSAGLVTLSGHPVPVQVADQNYYVNSAGAVAVSNVGVQSTISLGSTTTGTTMQILPVILENNEVLMQVAVNLSSLRGMRTIESNGALAEAPNIASQQFMQAVKLQSGSTLVMSGFEQSSDSLDRRGIGSPRFWLGGGGANSDRSRRVLVITLTPKVL